jgi:phosphohistidine phosphatase
MKKNQLQIMLVGSSKRNHWVVPKGIHEPGLSAQKSAEHEAYEEAGIRGTVSKSMLGVYEYAKWGASCRVEVYVMRVKEILPDSEWEETHRGRKWLSTDAALSLIKEPSMRPMIESLHEFIARNMN